VQVRLDHKVKSIILRSRCQRVPSRRVPRRGCGPFLADHYYSNEIHRFDRGLEIWSRANIANARQFRVGVFRPSSGGAHRILLPASARFHATSAKSTPGTNRSGTATGQWDSCCKIISPTAAHLQVWQPYT